MTTIPLLLGEKNLEQWKFILRRTLKDYQLCQYIDAVIPEPQGEDQKRQWEDARAIVNLIITASLIHDATYETLVNHGWDTEGEDPKVTYETVLHAFPKVPEDVGTLITSRDKKWCGKCQKNASVKAMHCKECDKCHGGVCWKNNPELAPKNRGQNQRNTQKDSEKTAPPTTAGQNSGLGYGNLHGKKYWARNPTENKIIYANAVRFDEGLHFNAKTAAKEPQCEVVFTDLTVNEIGKRLDGGVMTEIITNTSKKDVPQPTIPTCDGQEQEPEGLPTPEATPERDLQASEIQLDAEYVADIAREAPIPPENPLPTPEAMPECDLQASDIQLDTEYVADIADEALIPPEHTIPNLAAQSNVMSEGTQQSGRTRHEAGHYKKLACKQNCFHKVDNRLQEAMEYALSFPKIEHQMNNIWKIRIPKNFRQGRKCPDYDIEWLPAMKQQFDSLEGVWTIVPIIKPNMKVLPGKWVYDEKMIPNTEKFFARARWEVCGNYEDEFSMQDVSAPRTYLEFSQFDFQTTILNAWIPPGTDYFVEQPHGLEKSIGMGFRLRKALCRSLLCMCWLHAIMPTLKELGFCTSAWTGIVPWNEMRDWSLGIRIGLFCT